MRNSKLLLNTNTKEEVLQITSNEGIIFELLKLAFDEKTDDTLREVILDEATSKAVEHTKKMVALNSDSKMEVKEKYEPISDLRSSLANMYNLQWHMGSFEDFKKHFNELVNLAITNLE